MRADPLNDGAQSVGGITVNRKSSVSPQITDATLAIAVTDPTQSNTAGVAVTVDWLVAQILSLDQA